MEKIQLYIYVHASVEALACTKLHAGSYLSM
jgi:hypothetical protein